MERIERFLESGKPFFEICSVPHLGEREVITVLVEAGRGAG